MQSKFTNKKRDPLEKLAQLKQGVYQALLLKEQFLSIYAQEIVQRPGKYQVMDCGDMPVQSYGMALMEGIFKKQRNCPNSRTPLTLSPAHKYARAADPLDGNL